MMIYGWTTYSFIRRLPSWLYYLKFQEILSNYSYAAIINFLEALLFMGGILVINFLLPRRLFLDLFVARGSLFAVLGVGYLIYLALAVGQSKAFQFPEELFLWAPAVFLALLVVVLFLARVEAVRRISEDFADRAVIFLYVLLPLTSVGLLVFLFNNIF